MLEDESIKLYYDNIGKQRLWQENAPKIKGSGRSYPYLHPIRDLAQGSFHRCFHVCIDQISLLRSFLINNELRVN